MNYYYKKQLNINFEEAIKKTKTALSKKGFGVLTEIDVKKTLKNKLNKDYDNYIILGACNPPFAFSALQLEKEIGLLLPCNVIVYQNNNEVYISTILPTVAMGMVNNLPMADIAKKVEEKLKKVIDLI